MMVVASYNIDDITSGSLEIISVMRKYEFQILTLCVLLYNMYLLILVQGLSCKATQDEG